MKVISLSFSMRFMWLNWLLPSKVIKLDLLSMVWSSLWLSCHPCWCVGNCHPPLEWIRAHEPSWHWPNKGTFGRFLQGQPINKRPYICGRFELAILCKRSSRLSSLLLEDLETLPSQSKLDGSTAPFTHITLLDYLLVVKSEGSHFIGVSFYHLLLLLL